MHKDSPERRTRPRIGINGDMTYRTCGSAELHRGELEDMSADGARIWIDQELPTDSEILLQVTVNDVNGIDEIEEVSVEFKATLLHLLPGRKTSLYGYGCIIDESKRAKPTKN